MNSSNIPPRDPPSQRNFYEQFDDNELGLLFDRKCGHTVLMEGLPAFCDNRNEWRDYIIDCLESIRISERILRSVNRRNNCATLGELYDGKQNT